jgi:hypothetical protein
MADPIEQPGTGLERWILDRMTKLLNPRMLAWLVLTVILGVLLYLYFGRAEAVGSLAVTIFNASALGYLGYRIAVALEGHKRPHEIWEEADAARQSNDPERGWQLEQLADSMQRRRTTMVAACVVAACLLKF